jgi:hypothetical protein
MQSSDETRDSLYAHFYLYVPGWWTEYRRAESATPERLRLRVERKLRFLNMAELVSGCATFADTHAQTERGQDDGVFARGVDGEYLVALTIGTEPLCLTGRHRSKQLAMASAYG